MIQIHFRVCVGNSHQRSIEGWMIGFTEQHRDPNNSNYSNLFRDPQKICLQQSTYNFANLLLFFN